MVRIIVSNSDSLHPEALVYIHRQLLHSFHRFMDGLGSETTFTKPWQPCCICQLFALLVLHYTFCDRIQSFLYNARESKLTY